MSVAANTNIALKSLLYAFLILYASKTRFPLDAVITKHLTSPYVQALSIISIAYFGSQDTTVAVLLGLIFILVNHFSHIKNGMEHFEGQNAVLPGCYNITVSDLLESFANDKTKLMNAMLFSRVPGNLAVSDYNAPLIATYLINHGMTIKAPCSAPGVDPQSIVGWNAAYSA